jgi:hypothetical protein
VPLAGRGGIVPGAVPARGNALVGGTVIGRPRCPVGVFARGAAVGTIGDGGGGGIIGAVSARFSVAVAEERSGGGAARMSVSV